MNAFIERFNAITQPVDVVFLILGIIGCILFAFSGFPQMRKSLKEKHANGMAKGTIWAWFLGEIFTLFYTLYFYPGDFVYIINLTSNSVLVGIVLFIFYMGKNSNERIKRNENSKSKI